MPMLLALSNLAHLDPSLTLLTALNLGLLAALSLVLAQSQRFKTWVQTRSPFPAKIQPPEPDSLPQEAWWQDEVAFQAQLTQGQTLQQAIWGDSITAALGNTLGPERFNFALSGMTTMSLGPQMERLAPARVQRGAIALGTNDADRQISPEQYREYLSQAIAQLKAWGCDRIDLLPPHYPTPGHLWRYGYPNALERIEQLKQILASLADGETVCYQADFFASLYPPPDQGPHLRRELTTDGVHLNAPGRTLYRELLLQLWSSAD